MKGGIDVLNHVANIGFVLGDKLEGFLKFLAERPISESLDFTIFDFIYCQELFIVFCVRLEETSLTYQSSRFLAAWVYAQIQDILALMTFKQTFGSH